MNCFLHYRFESKDAIELIKECFHKHQIEFREIDNLIMLSASNMSFMEVAAVLYKKLLPNKLIKSDYLYLYTSHSEKNWFCIILKKIGITKMHNIDSRLLRR